MECVVSENCASVAEKVGNVLVRLSRYGLENSARGFLWVVNRNRKKKLPKISNSLLLQPAAALASKIRKGEVSSVDVVKAYIQRITEVNPIIGAVVDNRFQEALDEASKADELVRSGSKSEDQLERETPLLGVPFSSKEACLVKGLSSTCGLVCRKGMKAVDDCGAADKLRNAGAIPIAATNTSEVCMWWETYNKLYGQTSNPYDSSRTVGGSSGGEAALIAAGGSVIGLGTDLGGSIRLPCFFCGIFGHKPSPGLVPHNGQFPPVLNEITPYVVTGPIVRYASDLRLLLKVLSGETAVSKHQLDTKVPLKNIRVRFMMDDGGQPARSPVDPELKGAMKKVLRWLQDEGVSVKEAHVKNIKYGFMVWGSCLSKVQDQRIGDIMNGQLKSPEDADSIHYEMWRWFSGKSEHTFPIILNAFIQDYVAPLLTKTMDSFAERGQELKREMDSLFDEHTVFLFPTYPMPAQRHGQLIATPVNVGYSVVFNALGLPVTQCPLGFTSSGLPIGMQIVAAHGNDKLTISLAEEIESKYCAWVEPC